MRREPSHRRCQRTSETAWAPEWGEDAVKCSNDSSVLAHWSAALSGCDGLSPEALLRDVKLLEIFFRVQPELPGWIQQAAPYRECPAGTPLEPGEEMEFEFENDAGELMWWTGRLTGARTFNPARYGPHRLRLGARGSAGARRAAEDFLNAAWLQGNAESPDLLRDLARLTPGDEVNLREEGHAVRERETVLVWTGLSAFHGEPPQAGIPWNDWTEVLRLNLRFLAARAAMERHLGTVLAEEDLPGQDDLPSYRWDIGFRGVERWLG